MSADLVDWAEVERCMERAIEGRGDACDVRLFERARRSDEERYAALHAEVKARCVRRVTGR